MSDSQRVPVVVQRVRHYFPEVDSVVDATKPVIVTVKDTDNSTSKKKTHDACALAHACERERVCDAALIFPRIAFLVKGKTAIRYRVPESVTREIVVFDRGGDFAPGDYQLSPCSKRDRLGNKTPRNNSKRNKKTRAYRKPEVVHPTGGIRTKTVFVGK